MARRSILVTDGDERAALAVVRSLGRAGHKVHVSSEGGRSIAGASRYALAEAAVPVRRGGEEIHAVAIRRLIERWNIELLLPITEASLLSLLPLRDDLGDVTIPFPPDDIFRRICDRGSLLRVASELGIAVPTQRVLTSPREVELWNETLEYPAVLKPARSTTETAGRVIKHSVRYAEGPRELAQHLAELPASAYPLLLQRRVVGPAIGVFLLVWQGRTVAVFSHRRIREKPPSGGVSVCCESIPVDGELMRRSRALLDRFGWEGVAMVEWKVDEHTGTPYLMEVNARFWGSLQLAIDAGVDFPKLLVEVATGRGDVAIDRFRIGVRNRWWWGDVDHALARLFRSPRRLSLPPNAPSRWQTLRSLLTPWRPGQREMVFRWADPHPFVRETLSWLNALLPKRRRTSWNSAVSAVRAAGRGAT